MKLRYLERSELEIHSGTDDRVKGRYLTSPRLSTLIYKVWETSQWRGNDDGTRVVSRRENSDWVSDLKSVQVRRRRCRGQGRTKVT